VIQCGGLDTCHLSSHAYEPSLLILPSDSNDTHNTCLFVALSLLTVSVCSSCHPAALPFPNETRSTPLHTTIQSDSRTCSRPCTPGLSLPCHLVFASPSLPPSSCIFPTPFSVVFFWLRRSHSVRARALSSLSSFRSLALCLPPSRSLTHTYTQGHRRPVSGQIRTVDSREKKESPRRPICSCNGKCVVVAL